MQPPWYGTYNISLRVVHQNCSTPGFPAPTGQLRLTGNPDGTGLTVTIVERGTAREYGNGRLRADGSFTALGGGLIRACRAAARSAPTSTTSPAAYQEGSAAGEWMARKT